MALPKSFRLHLQKDFNLIFKTGRSIRTSFALIKLVNKSQIRPRIAVVISKKIAKTSVLRHRIKRVILNIMDQIGFRKSRFDCLVLVQNDLSQTNSNLLKKELMERVRL